MWTRRPWLSRHYRSQFFPASRKMDSTFAVQSGWLFLPALRWPQRNPPLAYCYLCRFFWSTGNFVPDTVSCNRWQHSIRQVFYRLIGARLRKDRKGGLKPNRNVLQSMPLPVFNWARILSYQSDQPEIQCPNPSLADKSPTVGVQEMMGDIGAAWITTKSGNWYWRQKYRRHCQWFGFC